MNISVGFLGNCNHMIMIRESADKVFLLQLQVQGYSPRIL
jgi:hypothetical protein